MGILKTVFILFILLFPVAEIGRIQFGNGIAITLNDLLLFTTIITWFICKIIRKDLIIKGFLKNSLIILLLIELLSLAFNLNRYKIDELAISAMYLLRWVSYSLLYFIVLEFDKAFKQIIIKLLLFSGFLVVVAGYFQFFLYPSLRNLYYLGWDEHLYRMFSTFLDPNFAGAFFVIYFIFTLFLLLNKFKNKRAIGKVILIILNLTSFFAIYLTYSRGAVLMLIISLTAFLWFSGKRKLIIIVLTLLILLIFISPKSFQTEGTNVLRSVSSRERVLSMQQGLAVFYNNPVLGVGFNGYRFVLNKEFGFKGELWKTTHSGAGTDNSFIFILATTGIIGFFAFLYLLFKMIKLQTHESAKNNYILIIPILLGLIVNSLFINSLFYVFILEWIWIILGLTENS